MKGWVAVEVVGSAGWLAAAGVRRGDVVLTAQVDAWRGPGVLVILLCSALFISLFIYGGPNIIS